MYMEKSASQGAPTNKSNGAVAVDQDEYFMLTVAAQLITSTPHLLENSTLHTFFTSVENLLTQ